MVAALTYIRAWRPAVILAKMMDADGGSMTCIVWWRHIKVGTIARTIQIRTVQLYALPPRSTVFSATAWHTTWYYAFMFIHVHSCSFLFMCIYQSYLSMNGLLYVFLCLHNNEWYPEKNSQWPSNSKKWPAHVLFVHIQPRHCPTASHHVNLCQQHDALKRNKTQ